MVETKTKRRNKTRSKKKKEKEKINKKIAQKNYNEKKKKEQAAAAEAAATKEEMKKKMKIDEQKIKPHFKTLIKIIKDAKFYLELKEPEIYIYNETNYIKLMKFYEKELEDNNEQKNRISREIEELEKETYKIGPKGTGSKKYEEWLNGKLLFLPISTKIEFIEDLIEQINTLIDFNTHGSVRVLSSAIHTASTVLDKVSHFGTQWYHSYPIKSHLVELEKKFNVNANNIRERSLNESKEVLLIIKEELEEKNKSFDLNKLFYK